MATGRSKKALVGFVLGTLWSLGLGGQAWGAEGIVAGLAKPVPTAQTPVVGQMYDVTIRLSNDSTTSVSTGELPIGVHVCPTQPCPASSTSIRVILACSDGTCATQLPGEVQFVPVNANGCVSPQPPGPCAIQCQADPANPTNGVLVTGSGCD